MSNSVLFLCRAGCDASVKGLRQMEPGWNIVTANSLSQAEEQLFTQQFGVVVSQLELSDGPAEKLFRQLQSAKPAVARIILAPDSDRVRSLQSMQIAHSVIPELSPESIIHDTIHDALKLGTKLGSEELSDLVSRVGSLPTLPETFFELSELLRKEDYYQTELVAILEDDPGLAGEVLRVANSAFFGNRRSVSSMEQAVTLLGTSTIKNIVIFSELFSDKVPIPKSIFSAEELREHSATVAHVALSLARTLGAPVQMRDNAFAAGLLHDIGKLVLARNIPEKYTQILVAAKDSGEPLSDFEIAELGAGHEEVGAYLLNMWGFPLTVVESVAFHDHPLEVCCRKLSELGCVSVANTVCKRLEDDEEPFDLQEFERSLVSKLDGEAKALWKGFHRAFLD